MLFHNSSEVYMQDLESGLSYMLKIEVANKPIIEGPAYVALQNFIDMLGEVRHIMYDRMITIFLSSLSAHDALTLLSQAENNMCFSYELCKRPTILAEMNTSLPIPL